MTRLLFGLALIAIPNTALAGKCDGIAARANTAKGAALVTAYSSLLKCDKTEAEAAYHDFMTKSGDVDTLVQLSLAAVKAKAFTPVWRSIDKIPDYSARDEVTAGVGRACADNEEVRTFLKGAYFALKDIQFAQWDDAYVFCDDKEISTWLEGLVSNPPKRSYDEKYNTLLSIWVKRNQAKALPALQTGAIEAAKNGGPYNAILENMDLAVQPQGLGASITDENRKALELVLVEVAANVDSEKAAAVADRLFNAGAEEAAASLLPTIYSDRVQPSGGLLYGIASVESCEKQAIIHYAEATEPAKRWSILADVEAPARAFKPKLKCTASDPWPVMATSEPVKSSKEVATWAEELVKQWAAKGLEAKIRAEKTLVLP
ncbi:MAG: hypothetical protein ACI9MC_003559 [Kiritimatiellia bacterium]|jgi:hypothetical protein